MNVTSSLTILKPTCYTLYHQFQVQNIYLKTFKHVYMVSVLIALTNLKDKININICET